MHGAGWKPAGSRTRAGCRCSAVRLYNRENDQASECERHRFILLSLKQEYESLTKRSRDVRQIGEIT